MPRGQYDRSPEAAAARATSKGGEKPAKTSKTAKTPKASKAAKAPKAVKAPKAPKAAKQTRSNLNTDFEKLNTLTNILHVLNGSSVSGVGNTAKAIFAKIEAIAERLEPAPKAEASGETDDTVKTSKKAPAAFTAPSQNGQAAFVPLARSAT